MKINLKLNNKYLKYFFLITFGIVISLIFEMLVFNYPGIRTFFEENKDVNIEYYILDANMYESELVKYENLNLEKGNSTLKNGNNLIFIPNINFPVSAINIYYDKEYDSKNIYNLNFTAYGNEYTYYRMEEKIINANKNDAYIVFDTKTDCYNIALYVNTNVEKMDISKIVLNHANFNILPLRIVCIFLIYILLYFIVSKKIYIFSTLRNPNMKVLLLVVVTIIAILLTSYIYYMINKISLMDLTYTDEDYIYYYDTYNAYVKSIIDGDEGFFIIEPMFKNDIYDMAQYNNKYYYYSMRLPIYLISIPFHIFTQCYINIYLINLILLIVTILISTITYNKIMKTFVKNISLFNYIIGFLALILGTNILFARRSYSCDLAFLCNLSLIMLGITFILSIINQKNKYIRKIYLLLLGIISGLLIFSTPMSIIYIGLFITLILVLLKKDYKIKLNELALFILPIILFIFLTANYNYNRFASPFEYGYKYNILRLDHTYPQRINLGYIITGIIENIFITPNIDLFEFPFFKMDIINNYSFLNEFTYAHNVIGIISFPIIWFLLFKNFLKHYSDDNTKKTLKVINIFILFAFITLFFNIALNGISEIYTLEFKFILMLSSLLFIFKYMENIKNDKKSTLMDKVFIILAILNLLIIVPISISTDKLYLYMTHIDFVNDLRNLFMFWI